MELKAGRDVLNQNITELPLYLKTELIELATGFIM